MRFLNEEIRGLWSALMFFTRLPLPCLKDFSERDMQRASTYFPLVGWLVGAVAAGVFLASLRLFQPGVASGLSLLATVLLTGAMHEDGFADACDGFGGGTNREKVLSIMQDSRVGTYGVVGLVLLLGLKWQLVSGFGGARCVWLLLASHSLSRGCAISLMASLDYARKEGPSKARSLVSRLSPARLCAITVFSVTPLFALPLRYWCLVPALLLLRATAQSLFRRRIGGYTGDCLGAVQQCGEILVLLLGVVLA